MSETAAGVERLGSLNGHSVGIVMKELVQRAMAVIRQERFRFVATDKVSAYKQGWDVVTSADQRAQEIVLRTLQECFPGVGIVAEEDELSLPCTLRGVDAFFTVDPLDGTKAFVRRQSHGIGTMLALVVDGEVAAAYVGDVMTKEIYGFRPGSRKVHRISDREGTERLEIDPRRPLIEQTLALREMPCRLSRATQQLAVDDGPFQKVEVGGGSIGIQAARLWKGEIGGLVLAAGTDTAWDLLPVLGISQHLGFGFFDLTEAGVVPCPLRPQPSAQQRLHDTLVIQESRVGDLNRTLGRLRDG